MDQPAPNLISNPHSRLVAKKFDSKEAFDAGFNSFQFFSELCLPDVCTFKWPFEYIAIWMLLIKAIRDKDEKQVKRVLRFALGLPRGFAKTTFIKLLVAWLIVYDFVTFVLVVCATEPHAENFLADVSDMLSTSNMTAIYGNWTGSLAIDNAKLKKATYRRRTVILAAIGSGTSVRGLNIVHERPDFIICDDMQTKENAESDTEALHLLNWFVGTLLKCVDPTFAVVAYIGNMYPQNCILFKLKENPYWTSLITGCILADGKSLWQELRPLEALYEEFKHDEALGLAFIWFAEMMNDPILERISLLPKGILPVCTLKEEEINPDAGFAIVDPAGFKNAADDNVCIAVQVMNGIPYVRGMTSGIFNPREIIEKTVELCLLYNIRIIFVESVAYQQTLCFWFTDELKRVNLQDHFTIKEVMPKNKSKDSRIRIIVQQLLGLTVFIMSQEVRHKFVFQALQYKIGKKTNRDDLLDAHAYIEDIRTDIELWALVHSVSLNKAEQKRAGVVANNIPF